MIMNRFLTCILTLVMCSGPLTAAAQTTDGNDDKDIWRQVELQGVDYEKAPNYCLRLRGFYRYIEDGTATLNDRMDRDFSASEGVCEIDVRYKKDADDGAFVLAARNLVHPDQAGDFVFYYELTPYTFLEKARRDPKRFNIVDEGDTLRVYTRRGLAGTVVRDTVRRELRMTYNALAPDTAMNVNLLYLRGHLSHVDAEAVYRMDSAATDYVPQGQLKRIVFDGLWTLDMSAFGLDTQADYHEHMEFYVDSAAYMTRDEYRASRKVSARARREGYTRADIDRLMQKLDVPPLTARQRQLIEDRRDWEEAFEQWMNTDRRLGRIVKGASKMSENEALQEKLDEMMPYTEKILEKITKKE